MGRGFRLFTLLLVLAVLGAIGSIVWDFLPAGGTGHPIVIEIPDRAGARGIAASLKAKGLIRSQIAFLLMARLLGDASHMQAGDYELTSRMTLAQIINQMARGDSLSRWVTIPEGYTVRQIATTLADSDLAEPRRFYRIARDGGKSFRSPSFPPPSDLEGYLFPDTYKIRKKATEREIIRTMLMDFDKKVAVPLRKEFEASARNGLPMPKIITLASLIEREARARDEQPIIAGVLLNRLKIGMRLQVDATVQYALEAPKRRLLYKDLAVSSPYNTYQIQGLPPGPICSPGLHAIEAALHPASVEALYYVAKPDGAHIFSRTLAEHNAARARVRRLAQLARRANTSPP